jgi:hypothetical protein
MNDDRKNIDISDGIEINSLTSYSSKINGPENNSSDQPNQSFNDLEETDFEEKIKLNNKSEIDSIEFVKNDDFFSDILIKKISGGIKKKPAVIEKSAIVLDLKPEEISGIDGGIETEDNNKTDKTGKTGRFEEKSPDNADLIGEMESPEKNDNDIDSGKGTKEITKSSEIVKIDDKDTVEELESIEPEDGEPVEILEAEEVIEENYDEITPLINKIDKTNDTVQFPGKISLIQIDKKLSNPELDVEESAEKKDSDSEEVFGIKKAEVFYTIDKKIYSSRHAQKSVITKIKNLKNGLFLPLMVAAISFLLLFIAVPVIFLYLKKNSTATLEENFISDNSILSQIAKQKEEEARRAKLDLEERMKNLEFEKTNIQATINQELLKKQAEIENSYQKKLQDIENNGGSRKQIDILKQQLEDEKTNALNAAKSDSDRKLNEQQKILDQKNKELLDADSKLTEAIKNKNFEINQMTKNLEEAIKEKNIEAQNISQKLQALSETNKKVKEFNQVVYQMISGAIDDFKNDNKDSSLSKLDNVVKYYNSRLEFVNANEDLSAKMSTDFAFIQTITKLIGDSKNSLLYDEELVKTMNKFKHITEYYKNAEINFANKDYNKSSADYVRVLNEIDEVNSSYNRMKILEKQIQNTRAVGYYNQALDDMKSAKYDLAMQELASVIRETPISDYANQALNDIVTLSGSLSASSKTAKSNEQAKALFTKAGDYAKNKLYKEALRSYQDVILNFPFSDFTADSLKNIMDIQSVTSRDETRQIDDRLRENFRSDYAKYVELSQKGNMREAREYYFSALKNAFNIYADNTIPDFKMAEDKYISSLLDTNRISANESLAKQIEDAKASLSKEYGDNLEKMKKQYEDRIASLKKDDSGKASQEELDKLKSGYESQLAAKNKDMDNIKKQYEDQIVSLKKNNTGKTSQEELDKLKTFYETQLKQKNKEIEKINNDLKNSAVAINAEDLNKEKENVAKLKQQLFDLYKKYGELEQKSRKPDVKADNTQLNELQKKYQALQSELDASRNSLDAKVREIEKQSQDEIKRQVDIEKERLQKEFNEQIKTLSKQNSSSNNTDNSPTVDINNLQTVYVARVIEIVDDAVTFQFLSADMIKKVKTGDRLKISRLTKNFSGEYKESQIGEIEIILINEKSLFGRGKIGASLKNAVQTNDLLKK